MRKETFECAHSYVSVPHGELINYKAISLFHLKVYTQLLQTALFMCWLMLQAGVFVGRSLMMGVGGGGTMVRGEECLPRRCDSQS